MVALPLIAGQVALSQFFIPFRRRRVLSNSPRLRQVATTNLFNASERSSVSELGFNHSRTATEVAQVSAARWFKSCTIAGANTQRLDDQISPPVLVVSVMLRGAIYLFCVLDHTTARVSIRGKERGRIRIPIRISTHHEVIFNNEAR